MNEEQVDGARTSLLGRVRVVHALPLVPLFILALLASGPIGDNSFLWHVRAGEEQFRLGHVLDADVFSFTELGEAWRTQSWLAELLYGGFEAVWPDSMVWASWLALSAALVAVLFVAIAVYRSTPSPLTTGLILLAVVWLLGPFVQPRPVVFSFALLAMLVVTLQNKERALWLVVPIIWIWAAVHGSWVIGGLLVVLEWGRTGDRRIFKVGVAALAASLATAHGIGAWLVVVDFLGAREALALMSEWKVPNFGSPAQMPYLLLIAGVVVAAVRGKIAARDLVVILPFMFLGMTARRTVVPAMIVLAPWAALAIPPVRIPRSRSSPILAAGVVIVVGILGLAPMVRASGELDVVRFPSPDVVARLDGTNPFYDDAVGGFLIYEQWPQRLVWIDDRAELHGVERLTEHQNVIAGQYDEAFDRYGFDAALSKPDWPLTDRLLRDGWTVDYETDEFVVLRP